MSAWAIQFRRQLSLMPRSVAICATGFSRSRREARTLKLENEILKRAAAYFARENVLPK